MANNPVKDLIRKRASFKAKLTSFDKYIGTIESVQGDMVTRAKVIELETRIRDFENIIALFEDVQNEIEYTVDENDLNLQYAEREEFNNRFYSLLSHAKELNEKINPDSDDASVAGGNSVKSRISQTNPFDGVKLPEIKLPKFDGSYQTWLDFRDMFVSLIHTNSKLNEIQKFHYLRATLAGPASQVIQSMEFCAKNYNVAWDTLCERFNNTNLLIQNHINAIFNMESIVTESASKIRNLNDDLFKHLTSLKQLNEPTEYWDTLIIYVISSKLDTNTAREWERFKAKQRTSCTLAYFKNFLKERADLLENIEMNFDTNGKSSFPKSNDNRPFNRSTGKRDRTRGLHASANAQVVENANSNSSDSYKNKYSCFLCKANHSLFYCPEFLGLSIDDRVSKINELSLCSNCLRRNHKPKECKWSGCKICNEKHNTVLHREKETKLNVAMGVLETVKTTDALDDGLANTFSNVVAVHNALLCTAKVQIRDSEGNYTSAYALLDCGSQSSFITSKLCRKLNLPTVQANLTITGINDKTSHSTSRCYLKVRSNISSYSFDLACFVLDKITGDLPDMRIDKGLLNIPNNICLADPEFDNTKPIDLLIGADAFWNLLTVGKIDSNKNGPILQNTRIGWIVAGPLDSFASRSVCNLGISKDVDLQHQVSKFWEVEEISKEKPLSFEEALCEKHFVEHLQYDSDGRYVVSLPLKDSPNKLGNSRDIAIKRMTSLERKLQTNKTLQLLYNNFLNEYEQLGHMTKISDNSQGNNPDYFLPHHGVLKEASSTTKLRVVFNASSPSSSGVSLNDLQMTGPTIQSDLFSIIIRFRLRPIVISGDIKMMYRQVLINPEDRGLQKIVWRLSPDEPIETFQLNTVTYGTVAGSFLAIRALHEVANECENQYPKVASIIKNDMYVDDLLTSVDSCEEAKYIAKELSEILRTRGFELRKWKSNEVSVLSDLNAEHSENIIEFSMNKDHDTKILGLLWSCDKDILTYKISPSKETNPNKVTKRSVLSRIATIFDPLGLTGPCIITAKVLLQRLWTENLTWDQPLPDRLSTAWLQFSCELDNLNLLSINRKITCENPLYIALHGFSDASESSYGSCLYVLSRNAQGECQCNLLCAKSRVAPLKTLTMPRLELCAALVLSQLISKVLESSDIEFNDIICWSDSTIVLSWLKSSPNLLKPFVNHRVAEIQSKTSSFEWRHVSSNHNPADLISRGVSPKDLINSDMWWHGPNWLTTDRNEWPIFHCVPPEQLPEIRKVTLSVTITQKWFPFERFSNLTKMKRAAALVFRFIENIKIPQERRTFSELTLDEINLSFQRILKCAQMESFSEDYSILSRKRELPSTSSILSLHPFIDNQGLLRVGGRLSNSRYSYSKKFPILISPNHPITKLIFRSEHEKLLHAGPQLLLSSIREHFWPVSGRSLARKTVRACIKCARYNARSIQPIMGNLPAVRVQPALPFDKVGIDYSGPFLMKDRRGRGCKGIKCWVAVFVCFSTKAIHLELVLSLTTDDFLQAFNRFIGRRGKPSEVFSDNGTNFIGANKELQLMHAFLQTNTSFISNSATNLGIKWHFIPANSPHFGGIWEAGVKSLKHHLKRVLGSYSLFFFDFQTLLVRIEAVLNSRPLCPLSSSPDDLVSLTPAHFLIGRSGTAYAEPSVAGLPENRLSQFQLIQKIQEQFWNRWQREYIGELQQRRKWKRTHGTLQIGDLVLIRDTNQPPMKWRLGRVLDLVSGADGVNRVASVKTMDGVISRAVVRLCPLPVES